MFYAKWAERPPKVTRSKMKQPSDMPTPRFAHSGSDLWSNTRPWRCPCYNLELLRVMITQKSEFHEVTGYLM